MKRLLIAALLLAGTACESKPAETGETTAGTSAATSGEAADTTAQNDGETSGQTTPEEPREFVKVEPAKFDEKAFPGDLPEGKLQGGIAFVDSYGTNHVAFTRQDTEKETVLHVKHVVQDGDEVREVRADKEVIGFCEFDIVFEVKHGEWSVTDLDEDGVGEATFAYTTDCTSDISPNKHTVMVTEGGKGFALRGATSVQIDDEGTIQGGEFKADEMEEAFAAHGKKVWDETSVGLRM